MELKKNFKIAIVAPAPFYYHAPLYRQLASSSEIDLSVYYCSDEVLRGKDIEKTYMVKGRLAGNDILNGYKNKFIKNYSPFPSYLTWPFGLMNFGIWQEIKNNKFDAVILQSWTNLTWWVAFFACLKFKTPVLFMTDANILSEATRSALKKKIKKLILGFLFKRIAGFLTTGKANEEFYKYYGVSPKKMIRFYFSWGYKDFFAKAQQLKCKRDIVRKSLGIEKDDFLVLYVGRLAKEKNPGIILEAFKTLRNKNKKLIFVGDGPLHQEISQQIKIEKIEGVSILGFQDRNKIGDFYVAADALVLPSSSETWGIVVNEAMCFGLPIIASDQVGATVDLLKNGKNGYIFIAGDVKGLANAINNLIDLSLGDRLSFGEKSSQIIKEWIEKIDPTEQLVKILSSFNSNYNHSDAKNKTILMVSPHLPWPLHGGPAVRIFNLLKEFSKKGYHITLLAGCKNIDACRDGILNKICDEVQLYQLPNQSKIIFLIRSIFSFKPYPALKFQSNSLKAKLKMLTRKKKFDLVWVNFSILADVCLNNIIGDSPVILDQHECEELVYKDYFRTGSIVERFIALINLLKLEKFHKKFLTRFSAILCVSKKEAEFTKQQIKRKINIWIAPNGVDRKTFYPDNSFENKSNRILLCSGMNVRRNIDAVIWFAKSIFPLVRKQVPDAEFWIVGSGPTQEVLRLNSIPGVKVIGAVDKIEEYYRMGKVFVAPYRFGAGTKLKVFEAMASGIPIVSTSIGCRGIDVIDKQHILISEDEIGFGSCVVSLLQGRDLSNKLSRNALALVKDKYYWENIVSELEPKIFEIIKNKNMLK